jgi:SAM-dependent methyltransferase
MTDLERGQFAHDQAVSSAKLHLQHERMREESFQSYFDVANRFAPRGKWLDVGCGTGTLIRIAKTFGIEVEGIELTPDRRTLVRRLTGATVYERPIEALDLPPQSFSAVTLINVFSHLVSPSVTFSHVHRALCSGGILLIHTSEIGAGVGKHHMFSWELGDHLHFLGENTIEQYASKINFALIYRTKIWQPSLIYTRQRFKVRGRSKLRNFAKSVCVYTPFVFPALRWYMLKKKHLGNPVFDSTLVLKKVEAQVAAFPTT